MATKRYIDNVFTDNADDLYRLKRGKRRKIRMRSSSSGYWTALLPQKLIVTPDVFQDDVESTVDWSVANGNIALNNTEKHYGSSSVKVIGNVGATVDIKKLITADLSVNNGGSLRLWIYPHSDVVTTIDDINIFVCTGNSGFVNYVNAQCSKVVLKNNEWNLLPRAFDWIFQGGIIDWSDVRSIVVRIYSKVGQIVECSLDLINGGRVLKPSCLIMFDDGWESNYTKAYPLLKAKGMVATVYVATGGIGDVGYLTSAQLIDLYNNRWDIGNHTYAHLILTSLTNIQVEAQFETAKNVLDGLGLIRGSNHIAYPGGLFNDSVISVLAAWGGKTGRKITDDYISEYDSLNYPYELYARTVTNDFTLAQVKSYIDVKNKLEQVPILLFHDIVDANADISTKWLTSDFSDLLVYLESEGYQTLTIDEYDRLNSGAIIVNHK